MTMRDFLINKLRAAKALRLDASRPLAVEKVRSMGHLTARERTASPVSYTHLTLPTKA